jgi:hypothetical protein
MIVQNVVQHIYSCCTAELGEMPDAWSIFFHRRSNWKSATQTGACIEGWKWFLRKKEAAVHIFVLDCRRNDGNWGENRPGTMRTTSRP